MNVLSMVLATLIYGIYYISISTFEYVITEFIITFLQRTGVTSKERPETITTDINLCYIIPFRSTLFGYFSYSANNYIYLIYQINI